MAEKVFVIGLIVVLLVGVVAALSLAPPLFDRRMCPAGGRHIVLDRRSEIGMSGDWVPIRVELQGEKGKWIQEYQACSKCHSLFASKDYIVHAAVGIEK